MRPVAKLFEISALLGMKMWQYLAPSVNENAA
jgi:hypothetical protein